MRQFQEDLLSSIDYSQGRHACHHARLFHSENSNLAIINRPNNVAMQIFLVKIGNLINISMSMKFGGKRDGSETIFQS